MWDRSCEGQPKPGDVVLRLATRLPDGYTMSLSGDAPQIVCLTYREAIARAARFARSQHVDVWRTDDGRVFTRMLACRLATPA